ncbi:MAG: dihydrofolate reductase family protein [Nanoarchaeota archaeon]|nr:dihydrofolate reductase family protein [Nanoarchaeota archaeon]
MSERTFNTLFMLSSVDGKISTGSTDQRDVDKDFPKIKGLSEGLPQYYELEQQTDLHSFNTGRVMAKIGMNEKKEIKKTPVSFIILDNTHLNKTGVENLIQKSKKLYLVTTNKNHPAFKLKKKLELLYYPKEIDFEDLFKKLKQKHKVEKVTIQSGGTLNAILVRKGLIDRVSIVIAPALIGGKDTSTLVDGKSLSSERDLQQIKVLKLRTCEKLKNSYLHLEYDVMN